MMRLQTVGHIKTAGHSASGDCLLVPADRVCLPAETSGGETEEESDRFGPGTVEEEEEA